MKKIRQILSIIIATAIFTGIFSVATPVFASEIDGLVADETVQLVGEGVTDSVELEADGSEGPVILDEIYSLRDEYTKVFRQSDGTYLALRYPVPVHYEESGQWIEYDMSLVSDDMSSARNVMLIIIVIIAGTGLALGTELVQAHLQYRTAEKYDLLADMIGLSIGAFMTTLYIFFKKHQ